MEPVKAASGRPVDELTVDRVRDQQLSMDDIRIHPDTLNHQADLAARFGNDQLAASLRRAAEMTRLDDEELMRIYDALRPGRSSADELRTMAAGLAARQLPRCAQLVTEAAEVYHRCGLSR
jgi:propanediol dehydratase small subunit